MNAAEALERELLADLDSMPERLRDDEFSFDLYRALANNAWHNELRAQGRLSLSWKRAEEVVNAARARHGQPPLGMAQSGGEGTVSALVERVLGGGGWTLEPLDTAAPQADHLTRPEFPPPQDQGDKQSPVEDSRAWERTAHAEAERTRKGTDPVPATAGTGAGGGRRQAGPA